MKNTYLLIFFISIFSCNMVYGQEAAEQTVEDNQELKELYKADQGDRSTGDIDWSVVSVRDAERQKRVYELLDSNKVVTSEDYANAAMIFQHGGDTIASSMAVKMMQKAVDLDPNRNKWLLAAAIDRDLMRKGKPQIYGTQYRKMGADEPWELYELDPTVITDEQRKEYGVETIAEQQEKVKMMNKTDLNELVKAGKNIDEIITLIKNESEGESEYNLSEMGINMFGYQLMGGDKDEDALKIFKLNTELHPEAYNPFDSYGECLIKMGQIEEGIAAYKKSLELNPKNDNAVKVLEGLKKR